ncbi:hypothetical protein RD792_017945, partial [Penstemon davidsonii]
MKKNSSQSQSQTKKVSGTSIQHSYDNQIDSVPAIPYPENCKISRTDFPKDFIFGVGTSAYQHEGGAAKDGRGHSIWDVFTLSTPDRIVDGSNGNVAVDMYTNYKEDIKVMKSMGSKPIGFRFLGLEYCLVLEPVLNGSYPQNMIDYVPKGNLDEFSTEESTLLKGSIDFLGLNYYTTYYASNDPTPDCEDGYYKDQQVNFPLNDMGGRSVPVTYENIPDIYITENGVDEKNNCKLTAYEACTDTTRIKYHQDHLAKILEAMNDYGDNGSNGNLNIKGYFLWSWCDNFEWVEGYTVRFGIIYVDYMNNLRRYPKHSAK